MECTICEAIEWRNDRDNAYAVELRNQESLEECIDAFVGPLNERVEHACPEHEVDLAAALLRIEGWIGQDGEGA